jgi:hypothetical protein
MKKKTWIYLLGAIIAAISIVGCDGEEPEPIDPDSEYVLFSVYLDSLINENTIVVPRKSNSNRIKFSLQESFIESAQPRFSDSEAKDLIRALPEANADTILFESDFQTTEKEIVIEQEQIIDEAFSEGQTAVDIWAGFYNTYGEDSRIVAFSRVAYNINKTKALFFVTESKTASYGKGVYLEKVDGMWRVADLQIIWLT